MGSSSREDIQLAFKELAEAMDTVADLDFTGLTTPERFAMLRHCEQLRCRLPVVEHPLIDQIANQATMVELGGRLPGRLAEELRITRREANRRIGDAAVLGPRHTLQGEALAPIRPTTATAQRDGQVNGEHVAVIRLFAPGVSDAGLFLPSPPHEALRTKPRNRRPRPHLALRRPPPADRPRRLHHPPPQKRRHRNHPPPRLDHGQPRVNDFHHPERILRRHTDDAAEDDADDP